MQFAPWVFPLTKETASVPRMCGEKIRAVSATTASVGSPPRVRGKGVRGKVHALERGITPACAGKSAIAGRFTHPSEGSPPRVRGKDHPGRYPASPLPITPACAGKRRPPVLPVSGAEDHPRVCGEKSQETLTRLRRRGSPPRVRGKVLQLQRQSTTRRITPACAGKSVRSQRNDRQSEDHPRVCGEK